MDQTVERERIEVRLSLLQVGLARGTLALVCRDQRAHGEFRESDGRDQWLGGQHVRIADLAEPDHR